MKLISQGSVFYCEALRNSWKLNKINKLSIDLVIWSLAISYYTNIVAINTVERQKAEIIGTISSDYTLFEFFNII